MKQPAKCFEYIQPLIGQKMDSPLVKKFQSQFPQYKLEKHPERGTVMFKVADESFSIEEFVAMILEYAVC
jgi:molecular chaperone DnaK (HSP70)